MTAGIVRIKSTLALDRFVVSETYRDEIPSSAATCASSSEPEPLTFDGAGNFAMADDPLAVAAH